MCSWNILSNGQLFCQYLVEQDIQTSQLRSHVFTKQYIILSGCSAILVERDIQTKGQISWPSVICKKYKREKVTCVLCKLNFRNNVHVEIHMEKDHDSSNNRISKCDECIITFKEKSHLDTHKQDVHIDSNTCCSRCKCCNLRFKNKDTLYMHDKTVHRLSQYNCDERRVKLKTVNKTDRHTYTHSKLNVRDNVHMGNHMKKDHNSLNKESTNVMNAL